MEVIKKNVLFCTKCGAECDANDERCTWVGSVENKDDKGNYHKQYIVYCAECTRDSKEFKRG